MCSCYGDIKAVNYEYHDILQGRDTFHKHWSEDQFRAALHKERREDEDRTAFLKNDGFKYSNYMYI